MPSTESCTFVLSVGGSNGCPYSEFALSRAAFQNNGIYSARCRETVLEDPGLSCFEAICASLSHAFTLT